MGMQASLFITFFGIFLCDSEGTILHKTLFLPEPRLVSEKMLAIDRGELIDEVREVCGVVKNMGIDKLILENEKLARTISKETGLDISVVSPDPVARILRSKMMDLAIESHVVSSEEGFSAILHEVASQLLKHKIKAAVEKQDLLIIQAITALDEVDKLINLSSSRVREWYGYHFPEANSIIQDHEVFLKFVINVGLRDGVRELDMKNLGFSSDKVEALVKAASSSIGASLDKVNLKPIMDLASATLSFYRLRKTLEQYIDELMDYVAPNIKGLVGSLIGARLIALAGGIEKLIKMPTSTIQLLGAEKALFRAIRTGAKPPKHGIIFQHPEVHRAPRWQRGKIARALASKLTIAARIDFFSGEYVADELKEDLQARVEEIKRVYAKPLIKPQQAKRKARKR